MTLEYRWPPKSKPGKGGVLIRMSGPDKIWPKSLEAQINWPDAGDFWGLDGYSLDGPAQRLKKLDHPQFGKLVNLKKTRTADEQFHNEGPDVGEAADGCDVQHTGGDDQIEDPVRIYLMQMGEMPLLTRQQELTTVLSNNFGFGGTNASMVIRRFDG